MPQSLGQIYIHLVLSTVDQVPYLGDATLRRRLYGYVAGIFRTWRCPSLWIGGAEEHIHALFRLSRMQSLASVVHEVTESSTIWLRDGGLRDFGWLDRYGAFSVSPNNVGRVVRYIKNQEEFHRGKTFEEEYQGYLERCDGFEYKVDVHLIFSTKNRIPFLKDKAVREGLHVYLESLCDQLDGPALRVGGVEDHVHILCGLTPEQEVAQVIQELKTRSTAWLINRQHVRDFDWQDGYGAFSVRSSAYRQAGALYRKPGGTSPPGDVVG